MTEVSLPRRIAAEALGTALLLAAVVGSGIMGTQLSGGNEALALLGNTLSTGAALVMLISVFGPISGAHFNPLVTAHFLARGEITAILAAAYVTAQFIGAIAGVLLAHAMFALPLLEISTKLRAGLGQDIAEVVATFGLILTIAGARHAPDRTPLLVGLYITAGYWFTASTSFANPAVTVARALTDTFAGIAPTSVPGFIFGQIAGAVAGSLLSLWLFRTQPTAVIAESKPGRRPNELVRDPRPTSL